MFRLFIISGLWLLCLRAGAQSWPGFETGRFSGISSATQRPGGMAPNPFIVDATVLGVHVFTQAENLFQNQEAFDEITSGGFKGLKGFTQLNNSKTYVAANIQGPSALVSINKKVAVAFAWNMRFLWSSRFSEPKLAKLFDSEASTLELDGSDETVTTVYNSWQELCFGAAGVVWEKDYHSLSVGGFAKMVFGTGNMNIDMNNINVHTSEHTVEHMSLGITATFSQQVYDLVDEGTLNLFDRIGFGFDLGAEYRFQNPRSCPGASNYRAKAGFALTDIGQTRYNSALNYTELTVSADNISLDRFRSATTLRGAVDTLKEIFDIDTNSTSSYNVTLPMSMRLYGEVNVGKRIFIYNEFHFLFVRLMQPDFDLPLIFRYNVTPRFEDDRFGVYLPLTFTNYIPASVGLALRWKPFIIGSSNVFTFWAYDDLGKAIDLYLTIKVPILKKEERIDHKRQRKA